MNRTIAALCVAGFIAGCETAPETVDHVPVHTLTAVETNGPDYDEKHDFNSAEECELARSKAIVETTDIVFFCIKR